MDRAGLSANDGPTHHGLFDIAYLRCLPNVIAMAPKDEDELADMMFTATHQNHPDVHPLPARRGGRRADQGPAASCSKSARRRSSRIFPATAKRKVALFGLGPMNTMARKAAAATRGGRL